MNGEELTIEYKGKEYTGRRIIEGSRKMFQTIYRGPRSKYDGHPYGPGEEATMNSVARIILRELVEEELREGGEDNA
jgi:hypothetical protein